MEVAMAAVRVVEAMAAVVRVAAVKAVAVVRAADTCQRRDIVAPEYPNRRRQRAHLERASKERVCHHRS